MDLKIDIFKQNEKNQRGLFKKNLHPTVERILTTIMNLQRVDSET